MLRLSATRSLKGFTLIELMIAVSVLGILLALGVPSYQSWIQTTQIRNAAESIKNGLQLARAEAVRRNERVRFTVTSATGKTDWTIGCVTTSATCPATIQTRSSGQGSTNAVMGVSTSVGSYGTFLGAGTNMTGAEGVTFNGLGRMVNIGTDIMRFDVSSTAGSNPRRLVIVVSTGGQIRMCDPAVTDTTDPRYCS